MSKEKKHEQTAQQPPEQHKYTETAEQTEQAAATPLTELEKALTEENEKLIAEAAALQQENDKLHKTVKRLQSSADKSDTYLNQLVAMKNDFESYKRRMRFNAEQAKTEGVQSVIAMLIGVCDNFELAKQHLDGDNLKAFEMIYAQFLQILHQFGVEEMDVLGKPFDALRMNALSKLDRGEQNKDLVVEVYKKGYVMGDKVLRYAEVVVGA